MKDNDELLTAKAMTLSSARRQFMFNKASGASAFLTDAPILWQNALINFLYIMYFAVEKKAFLWYNTCIYIIKDRESLVFSDIFFLYVFLPLFLICYFAARNTKLKNAVLIVFSLFFYAWGEPVWVGLLIFSSVFDFLNGRFIDKHKDEKIAVLGVIVSCAVNLSILGVFKYSGMIVDGINTLLSLSLPVPANRNFFLHLPVHNLRGRCLPQKGTGAEKLLWISAVSLHVLPAGGRPYRALQHRCP